MLLRSLALAAASLVLMAQARLECRHSAYLAHDGKLYAVDPKHPTVELELSIKGVEWRGMEQDAGIPDGLWGTAHRNRKGVRATTFSTLMRFLTDHAFNAVRLPLNAAAIVADAAPRMEYMHGYENRELTGGWSNMSNITTVQLLGRIVQAMQEHGLAVLLEIQSLDAAMTTDDPYWYTPPMVSVTETVLYRALSMLASTLCSASMWNILGVDLKSEMTEVQWNAQAQDGDPTTDWPSAAQVLADRVVELCPQWLVFVGGAASPTDAQRFQVNADYHEKSRHWPGGNLHNATENPIRMSTPHKLVYAPHAHAHGKYPQNYLFTNDSNCSTIVEPMASFDDADQFTVDCKDFVNGTRVATKLPCSDTAFGCFAYQHLPRDQLVKQYHRVLDEAMGSIVANKTTPVIWGSFSGVFGADTQPQQTAVLELLIEYAATQLRGGFFAALNPDTEYFLEDASNNRSGMFGRTHYGVFKTTSWQEANNDLLQALAKLPSTPIPCFGSKKVRKNELAGNDASFIASISWVLVLISLAAILQVAL